MGVRRGLSISAKENLIVANDDEDHTRGARLKKEVFSERVGGLQITVRRRGMDLRANRYYLRREHQE
jgi:hypothetical protein